MTPPSQGSALVASARRARVLIVDDEPLVAAALKRMLRSHEAEVCYDPQAAIDRFGTGAWDLMFCDLHMPGFGGVDVYRAVRERFPGREERIVFMSGAAVDAPEGVGARPCIEKPFDRAVVLALLAEVVGT